MTIARLFPQGNSSFSPRVIRALLSTSLCAKLCLLAPTAPCLLLIDCLLRVSLKRDLDFLFPFFKSLFFVGRGQQASVESASHFRFIDSDLHAAKGADIVIRQVKVSVAAFRARVFLVLRTESNFQSECQLHLVTCIAKALNSVRDL